MKIKSINILQVFLKLFFLIILVCTILLISSAFKSARNPSQIIQGKLEISIGGKLGDFVFAPNINQVLTFKINSTEQSAINYTITDYLDNSVSTGGLQFNSGIAKATVNLPAGYYQINFPGANKSFGLLSIMPFKGNKDPFFCIDAALSGIEPVESIRGELINMVQQTGISEAREAFSSSFQRDYNTRQMYHQANIPVLELLLHDFDSQSLDSVSNNWSDIYGRYKDTWGGVEINNEPDIKGLPGDQYVSYVKASSYLFNSLRVKAPIIGGVFASSPDRFHEICSYNGLLNNVDGISFHNYDKATLLQATINRFRNWLQKSGKGSMPLWITESGMPGSSGKDRPVIKEDAFSAVEITMKAVEAKACGISKYMAFVLDFYNEPPKSYGLLGKEKTPLRSLSAYINCTSILSGYDYTGDLINKDPKVKISRIFTSNKSNSPLIVVLYTGELNPGASVKFNGTAKKIIGIDGRELSLDKNNRVPIPDGLTYVFIDPENAAQIINKNTLASKLLLINKNSMKTARETSPIVLQYLYKKSNVIPTTNRYFVSQANSSSFLITVRVHNLSNNPITENLRLKVENGSGFKALAVQSKLVTVNGKHSVDVNWKINLSKVIGVGTAQLVEVDASSSTGNIKESLYLPFLVEGTLSDNLKSKKVDMKLALNDLSKWHKNITPTGTSQFSSSNGNFVINSNFSGLKDNWAYPKVDVPQVGDNLSTGVLVRAKISDKAKTVALFINTNDNKTYWVNNVFPADGAWHAVYVDFSEFQPYSYNESNYTILPGAIKQFMIGMQSLVPANSMEISDLELVSKK